jgi:hypothetical protein
VKLMWAGLIFGAGYVLGRPEARAKLAELMKRPEVAQLRQQAASTASTAAQTGQQQLAKAARMVKDTASQKRSEKTEGSGGVPDPAGSRRGVRLPSFPRRGVHSDASAAAGPAATVAGTVTDDTSTSPEPVTGVPDAPSAPSP